MAVGAKFTLSFVAKFVDGVTTGLKSTTKSLELLKNVVTESGGRLGKLAGKLNVADARAKTFNTTLAASGKKLEMMGSSIQRMGRWLAVSFTAPIILFAKKAGESFLNFEKNLNFAKVLLGATGKEMDQLTGLVRHLGATTEKSAVQVSEGVITLARAGQQLNDVSANLPAILNLSTAAQTTMAKASTILTDVIGAYNLKASDSIRIVDILAKVSSTTQTNLLQLGNAMGLGASTGKALGLTLTETVAVMASFARAGLRGGRAGRSFRRLMSSLANPTLRFMKAINKLNITLFVSREEERRTGRRLRNIVDIGKEFEKATRKFGAVKIQEVLGMVSENAKSAMNALLLLGAEGFGAIEEAARNSAGFGAKMAEVFKIGILGTVVDLKNKFEDLLLTIMSSREGGLGMAEVFVEMGGKLTNVLKGITEWIKENPKLAKSFLKVIAAVAALGPVLVIFGSLTVILGLVKSGAGKVIGVFTGFGRILKWFGLISVHTMTNITNMGVSFGLLLKGIIPLTFAFIKFAAIGGIVAAVARTTINNWSEIEPFFKGVGEFLVATFKSVIETITPFLIGFVATISVLTKRTISFMGFLMGKLKELPGEINRASKEMEKGNATLFGSFLSWLGFISKIFKKTIEGWTLIFKGWASFIGLLIDILAEKFEFIRDFIKDVKLEMASLIKLIPESIRKKLGLEVDTTDAREKLKALQQEENVIRASTADSESKERVGKLTKRENEKEEDFTKRKEVLTRSLVEEFRKERALAAKQQEEELLQPEKFLAIKEKQMESLRKKQLKSFDELGEKERNKFLETQSEERKALDNSFKAKFMSISEEDKVREKFLGKQERDRKVFEETIGEVREEKILRTKTPVVGALNFKSLADALTKAVNEFKTSVGITITDKTVNGIKGKIDKVDKEVEETPFIINVFPDEFMGQTFETG